MGEDMICTFIEKIKITKGHLYKGNSKQGQSMADLIKSSKNFIGLTGTLLNGYADGLFYILYRALPKLMIKEGFSYKDEAEFLRQLAMYIKDRNK